MWVLRNLTSQGHSWARDSATNLYPPEHELGWCPCTQWRHVGHHCVSFPWGLNQRGKNPVHYQQSRWLCNSQIDQWRSLEAHGQTSGILLKPYHGLQSIKVRPALRFLKGSSPTDPQCYSHFIIFSIVVPQNFPSHFSRNISQDLHWFKTAQGLISSKHLLKHWWLKLGFEFSQGQMDF